MTVAERKIDPLEKELKVYQDNLPALLSEEGKFALIVGSELVGVYSAYEDALKVGYQKAKLAPFLVKKISSTESAMYFSRDVDGSCLTTLSA